MPYATIPREAWETTEKAFVSQLAQKKKTLNLDVSPWSTVDKISVSKGKDGFSVTVVSGQTQIFV